MECFKHASTAAAGICKNCGRGLCRACAGDLPFGIVCSDVCATELTELREINRRAKRIYGIGRDAKTRLPLASVMWGLFAVLFGGFGTFEYFRTGRVEWFLVLFALACVVLCVATYRRMKELQLNC